MLINETDASYLAGFFDADGSVGVYSHKGSRNPESLAGYSLRIYVGGTHRGSIERFSSTFGGAIAPHLWATRNGRRPFWSWQLHGAPAKVALSAMLPYLVVKKAQALEGLKASCGSYHPSKQDSILNRELSQRIKELKRLVA